MTKLSLSIIHGKSEKEKKSQGTAMQIVGILEFLFSDGPPNHSGQVMIEYLVLILRRTLPISNYRSLFANMGKKHLPR